MNLKIFSVRKKKIRKAKSKKDILLKVTAKKVFNQRKILQNIIKDDISGNIINNETFNELHKNDKNVNEVIGHSLNKKDWNIYEYNNYNLEKNYSKEYDNLNLDINYDILNKYETKCINDK